jgi:carboxymethylenebutenolidase
MSAAKNDEMPDYGSINHGFHNDTTPFYENMAATLSGKRTIEFFRQNLV